jgi:TRAP-type C4-dicarboxylate transport system permease small subunit
VPRWSAYPVWIHAVGVVVVLGGLIGIATGSISTEVLLADLPRRVDRKLVYFTYAIGAFYLALVGHLAWSAFGLGARRRAG